MVVLRIAVAFVLALAFAECGCTSCNGDASNSYVALTGQVRVTTSDMLAEVCVNDHCLSGTLAHPGGCLDLYDDKLGARICVIGDPAFVSGHVGTKVPGLADRYVLTIVDADTGAVLGQGDTQVYYTSDACGREASGTLTVTSP